MNDIDLALGRAIASAKRTGAVEVSPDDLLLGLLYARSRFGIVRLGAWVFDLEALGFDWIEVPEKGGNKVSYSDAVVKILDRAARIARADGAGAMAVEHVLVAFAGEANGLMGRLKSQFAIGSASWRAAVGEADVASAEERPVTGAEVPRDYLTPEEAAAALNIHVQTLRAYVRSGKLPARRLAGERAIRIRRADLDQVLEPFTSEK
ncbi:MAG: helix-turn-helix domain-containing protein [Verrucomicrobiota bacterium]